MHCIQVVNYFIKHNHTPHKHALLAEAKGLALLQRWIDKTKCLIKLPQVIAVNNQQLTLTNINTIKPTSSLQQQLGRELAKLHSEHNSYCGFETDNFIGLNPQKNTISENWGEFFWQYRLKFQVELIHDKNIRRGFNEIMDNNKSKLKAWLNQHCSHFSLLHGDLWSGNVLFDEQDVWLIDPAVYYGDSEADIAMTELFGGFPSEFYQSYQVIKPLSKVYPSKRTIYNLYHYLNHYNLFGSSYLPSCQSAFQQINQGFA